MSKSILSKVVIFVAGAAVGSAVTWKLLDAKYRRLANEEIEAVREVYRNAEESEQADEEPEPIEMKKLVREEVSEEEEDEEVIILEKIDYDDFDEYGFETETLVYYADGVLAYQDTDEVVDNAEELVGEDFEQYIGQCDAGPDTAYIRNHTLGIDFEILRDERKYSEVE